MAIDFKLPELGEGIESAEVSRIYVSDGDEIDADQNVMELESEKAVADLPCPHAGEISEIHVSEGDTVEVGQTLLTIEELEKASDGGGQAEAPAEAERRELGREADGEGEEEKPDVEEEARDSDEGPGEGKEEKEESREEADTEGPVRDEDESREAGELAATGTASESKAEREPRGRRATDRPPPAGPATRRLARKLDLDLQTLRPSDGGRITQEDVVRAFVESQKTTTLTGSEELPDFSKFGSLERRPLNKIARTVAKRLTASWRRIPQVTQHGLADITELESLRRRYLESTAGSAPKVTLTALLMKAVVGLLKEYPKFNSSLDVESGELVLKEYYNLGVAVDTDHGLLVPVVREADRKSVRELAEELIHLAERARSRQLDQDDMEGGTFTISNQGGIGGGQFTPIVNWPEVAILGAGRAHTDVAMFDGEPRERLKLPLSLSYDHRIIDGAGAAGFMERMEDLLSESVKLLMEC